MDKLLKKAGTLLAAALLGTATMQAQTSPVDMDSFIDDLMEKMTVEENADYATVSVREPLTPVGEFLNTINLNMAGALAILFAFIVSVVVILFFGLRRKNK